MKSQSSPSQAADQARREHAEWYNDFYKIRQHGLSPWYRFLLPTLEHSLTPTSQLVELGCGQAHILRMITRGNRLPPENITGVDQSQEVVNFCAREIPKARFLVGDLYDLSNLETERFDVCLLMETIEHLEDPLPAIANIRRILKPGGLLFVSFPNYLHLPWLVVRILAEKLNHPNWIVLQPVDKIYTVFGILRFFRNAGFQFLKGVGSNYGPPVFYRLEKDPLTRFLNSLGLWRFSFHPILVFRK